jgi:hypothetical protein
VATKKKTKKPVSPDLSSQVLDFRNDLSKKDQNDAVLLYSQLSEELPQRMAQAAESHLNSKQPNMRNKGRRYAAAVPILEPKPVTMDSMVNARKNAFYQAVSGPVRLPTEHVAGQEFYFRGHEKIAGTVGNAEFPMTRLADASARLSIQTQPPQEKAALSALAHAHTHGSVHFTPQVLNALRTQNTEVPTEFHGNVVPFKDIPGNIVYSLVSPTIRAEVQPHAPEVKLGDLTKTSMTTNLRLAHESLQGVRDSNPSTQPKLFSYGKSHEDAIPRNPEHIEYQLRESHIGKVARGEQSPNQLMFDFEGLRSSNEGILSNRYQTPNDSWMLANQLQQPQPVRKVAADINLTRKTGKTKAGRSLEPGKGKGNVTPEGLQHAIGNEATHRAAESIQQELGLDFTVPSMLVQEGIWAFERRQDNKDPEFNAVVRKTKTKASKKASKKNTPKPLPGFKDF